MHRLMSGSILLGQHLSGGHICLQASTALKVAICAGRPYIRVTFVWVKIQLVYSICWAKLGDHGPKAPSQGAKPPM